MANCVIIFQFLNIVLILLKLIAVLPLHAQDDQAGFISLDCGRPYGYTDKDTGLRYNSDNDFIDTGVSERIDPKANNYQFMYQQYVYVRSFPDGIRNCYTLNVPLPLANGKTFLIRGRFYYGNYDNKHYPPNFDLQIGVDVWDTVEMSNEVDPIDKEIIYTPNSDFIQVCLINTKAGIPFISALEIRPLSDGTIYKTDNSLKYHGRWDLGARNANWYRYKNDVFDRIWVPWDMNNRSMLTTVLPIAPSKYQLPILVMNTANSPQNSNDTLTISWTPRSIDQFYLYLHFAELKPSVSREFDIYINGKLFMASYSPKYLQAETIVVPLDVSLTLEFSLNPTKNSSLPPLLNAYELYTVKKTQNSQTSESDVGAIRGIKSTYKVLKNWQGDPCGPEPFIWDGINCTYKNLNPPQIISLNLSSSGLTGEISPFIKNLTSLQTLDLSNNSLSGNVPIFLSQFSSLQFLNLSGNNLTCPMPSSLRAKINNLTDDCKGNSTPVPPTPSKHGRSYPIIVIAASVGGFFIITLIVASILFYCIKRKRRQQTTSVQSSTNVSSRIPNKNLINSNFELKNCQFSYSEILKITNNFQRVLGKGGFGTVYQGYVGNTPVAVKMLSRSSTQGYKEFQAEAKFLVSVNHKNLIAIIGYCYEDDNMGLVYEFMENGNLENHISERSSQILNWEERLRIAVDAAQGLEYLHNGCKSPIVHRDVKSSNILLNGKFDAKLADFGLSRIIPVEGSNYVSTVVVGTPGYVDPEYFVTNRLTEKSDVYGFGIVLLEIVTGKSAVSRRQGNAHIISWVGGMISTADATQIADQRLKGDFDTNCFWKLVELAMACVSRESMRRPNMTQVVMELKECLENEIARHDTRSRDSMNGGFMSMGLVSDGQLMGPLAR